MSKALDIAYAIGAVVSSPVWGLSLLKTGKWRTDWHGRFGHVGDPAREACRQPGKVNLLIHAVSVGEVNLIRQLVALLSESHPELNIIISTTTNTGFARATQLYAEKHVVVRYPLDFSSAVGRFLDAIRPTVVALTELEVWPNFTQACVKRGIPIAVINGRLSERSFRGYKKLRPVLRPMFARLDAVAAQTEAYAERFRYMGVPRDRVHVLDTMKWDTARVLDRVEGADDLARDMGIDHEKPLIVAGSTGPGEEALLIGARPPDAQLLLVPRKPERFDEVARLSPDIVRRTAPGQGNPQAGLFLLDTMGELGKAYSLADIAIVGRSFNGWGGSDPIEPVALGKPTIIGPDHHNFADVVQALQAGDGLLVTRNPDQAIEELLASPARRAELAKHGREVILSRQGATQRHGEMLLNLLARQTEH
ncbi:MAG: lipid IV(A) 3-deoxy-D-manno-octulosonic acid transferase [Phycisphaeraceae bacterium]